MQTLRDLLLFGWLLSFFNQNDQSENIDQKATTSFINSKQTLQNLIKRLIMTFTHIGI